MSQRSAPPLVVAIFGPTGTGKTALACDLADRVPAHLISCDAVQIHRDLSAGAAKPRGPAARHPWALVDIVEPARDLNLGEWVRAAEREIDWAARAGRTPIVVGGTGLYLRGLLKGVAPAPARSERLRARLQGLAENRGTPLLHRVLARLDPDTAAQLAPNDRQRLVRALEVRLSTGKSLARLQDRGWSGPDRFPTLRIGLAVPRDELHRRLDERTSSFFRSGLVAECRWLRTVRGIPASANALAAIGYREVVQWLEQPGARSEADLVAAVQRSTRRYAKRQMTWFRREQPALWLDPRDPALVERAVEEVRRAVEREDPPRVGL